MRSRLPSRSWFSARALPGAVIEWPGQEPPEEEPRAHLSATSSRLRHDLALAGAENARAQPSAARMRSAAACSVSSFLQKAKRT